MSTITPESCRAARAILRWTTAVLAEESGVATTTINRIENGQAWRSGTSDTLVSTFARHGVEVLPPPRSGARLRADANPHPESGPPFPD